MASAMISVHTTASRFALLQVDSDSDSDSEAGKLKGGQSAGKGRPGKTSGGKAGQNNEKRKEKRKKRREQQQSEANELRSLAFKKLPQKSSGQPPVLTTQPTDQALPSKSWQQRDEKLTSELYEADLEKALILSKLEYEQQKQDDSTDTPSPKAHGGGAKEKKKKDKRVTVSLKDFQIDGSVDQLSKKQEKEGTSELQEDDGFFHKLEDDVSRIVQRERRREQFSSSGAPEVTTSTEHEPDVRSEQLKYDLEKKELEIQKLKKIISQWEVRYKEVKARNGQLLKMLQQGEMKDKAEILLQVDELQNIKMELSSQVKLLHASLEQEKSKVKGLQSEQPKHHQGNKKSKKASESDL